MTRSLLLASLMPVLAAVTSCLSPRGPTEPIEGAACSPRGPYLGSFDGVATGAVTGPASGCAYFAIEEPSQGRFSDASPKSTMIISNGERGQFRQTVGIFRRGRGFGRSGSTFVVGTPETPGAIYGRIIDNVTGKTYDLTSGIMSIHGDDPRGTITITGTETGGTATITLSGLFVARCLDPPPPFNDGDYVDEVRQTPCQSLGGV